MLKSGLATAGKVAGAGIAAIGTAAVGGAAALLSMEEATEEYRIAQGKLNTAFEAAELGSQAAAESYNGFYAILGDTDTATEASQLLAKLALDAEDISEWTGIAAGVYGTFGDSLPIEGLIEAANETAKVGEVTGVLADALNWAGISQDEMNEKLAAAGTETERNKILMETLSETYADATDAFYRNNEEVIRSRENQALLDATMGKLGGTVSRLKTSLLTEMLPPIADTADAFVGLIEDVEGSDEAFSDAVGGLIETGLEKLPDFVEFGVDLIDSLVKGVANNSDAITDGAIETVETLIDGLVDMLPEIVVTGVLLIGKLAAGLIEAIPDLVAKIPEIVKAIVQGFVDHGSDFLQIGKNIVSGIIDGLASAWNRITSWLGAQPLSIAGETVWVNGSHAGGLDYVPYDGYVAKLHRGEMVLTRDEALAMRNGAVGASVNVVQNIYSKAQTAADLMEEARYQQEKAVYLGA